jgi:hypothetical protein
MQYSAGIPSHEFEFIAAPQVLGRQRQSCWCWAACIQMVLNYHGLFVSQEQIVQRIYGKLDNKPASKSQILTALSGWAPDIRGRYSSIHATEYILYDGRIVNDLSYKWPLIVGFRGLPIGHACVLTAVNYIKGPLWPIFTNAVYRDPWPGTLSKKQMLWMPFISSVNFIIGIKIIRT